MQRPSIGCIVLVHMDTDKNGGVAEAPAIITEVLAELSDGTFIIIVKVIDNLDGSVPLRHRVILYSTQPDYADRADGMAWWPPRV